MSKLRINKEQFPAALALLITALAYASEKAFKRLGHWSSTGAILQAVAFTVAVLAVFLLLYRCKDYFTGMLAAIFAFKLLPPNLEMLRKTAFDAAAVYHLVKFAAPMMFVFIIYRLYERQKDEDGHIRLLGIIAILTVTPYISNMLDDYISYAYLKTDNAYLIPIMEAVIYLLSMAALAAICFYFRGKTAALACDYVIVAQILRMGRKASSALILSHANMYVGKSYFCWIAIGAVLIVCFTLIRKKTAALPARVEAAKETAK